MYTVAGQCKYVCHIMFFHCSVESPVFRFRQTDFSAQRATFKQYVLHHTPDNMQNPPNQKTHRKKA